jgi:hypothetical protein
MSPSDAPSLLRRCAGVLLRLHIVLGLLPGPEMARGRPNGRQALAGWATESMAPYRPRPPSKPLPTRTLSQ